jgi:hypothetical protein
METIKHFLVVVLFLTETSIFADYPGTCHLTSYDKSFIAYGINNEIVSNGGINSSINITNSKSQFLYENEYKVNFNNPSASSLISTRFKKCVGKTSPKSCVVKDYRTSLVNLKSSSYNDSPTQQEPALDLAGTIAWGCLGAIVGVIALKESRVAGLFCGFGVGAAIGAFSARRAQSY